MRSILWYVLTFGIPLLGLAICTLGGAVFYRRARRLRMGRGVAALGYFVTTLLPFVLAYMALKLGSYLAIQHDSNVFFGEDTWLLFIFMVSYFWLAVVSNLVLWLALALMKTHGKTTTA